MSAHHPPANATDRFSNRVADYVRYRPSYPAPVIELLQQRAGLQAGAKVADIGSGTGIFSKLLLEAGARVFAVEPNAEMREAAEAAFGDHPHFHSIAAPGEATTLPAGSMDLVTAAQAFHWLDRPQARAEFSRILKPQGRIALIWNLRQTHATPFLRGFEELLCTLAGDYSQVRHENVDETVLGDFFGSGQFEMHSFANAQSFDFEGLCGRLLSCSYAPAPDHPGHEPMLAALRRLYEVNQCGGTVQFIYETRVFIGY